MTRLLILYPELITFVTTISYIHWKCGLGDAEDLTDHISHQARCSKDAGIRDAASVAVPAAAPAAAADGADAEPAPAAAAAAAVPDNDPDVDAA